MIRTTLLSAALYLLLAGAWPLPSSETPAPLAPADTLRHEVAAGSTLIIALPEALAEEPVEEYRLLEAPPMSWLQDRSFMWQTREEDAGTHAFYLLARLEDASSDSVRVEVDVEP